jgi:hypothetical protein
MYPAAAPLSDFDGPPTSDESAIFLLGELTRPDAGQPNWSHSLCGILITNVSGSGLILELHSSASITRR